MANAMGHVPQDIVQLLPAGIAVTRVRVVFTVVPEGAAAAAGVRQNIVAAGCTSVTADVIRHVPRGHSLAVHRRIVHVIRLAVEGRMHLPIKALE